MDSQSIHPGVVDGRRKFPHVNTCGNSSLQKRMLRQREGIEKHLERHPRDSLSAARIARIDEILRG